MFDYSIDRILMHENIGDRWHHHMSDWMDFPNHMMGGSSWLGWFLTALFWAFVVIGIVLLVWWILRSGSDVGPRNRRSALDILEERYARGEIDEEEYDRRRKNLEGRS